MNINWALNPFVKIRLYKLTKQVYNLNSKHDELAFSSSLTNKGGHVF